MRAVFLICGFACTLFGAAALFVPAKFQPPQEYSTRAFSLVPLSPELFRLDYAAYMSSIDHLQKTFTFSKDWPNEKLTLADAMKDVKGEKARFDARESFTYSVLSPEGDKELGCVYIAPSSKQGYDATVRLWVTKEQYDRGFEKTLVSAVKLWVAHTWPFKRVAYLDRDISSAEWKKLPDKPGVAARKS